MGWSRTFQRPGPSAGPPRGSRALARGMFGLAWVRAGALLAFAVVLAGPACSSSRGSGQTGGGTGSAGSSGGRDGGNDAAAAGGGAGRSTGSASGGQGGPASAGATGTGSGGNHGGPGGGAGVAAGGRGTGGGPPLGKPFDIYWIDVEGGAATLLVAPSGQTLLVDGGFAGNNDRDVNRVLTVLAQQVHATRLDYVVTTHFHGDHVGGVTALAGRFPVGEFLDHGPSVEGGALYSNYVAAVAGKTRVLVKPGDRLSLGDVDLLFVSSAGALTDPLPTATANSHCAGAAAMAERPTDENSQSVGFLARFGAFDFLDLGDLTWAVEDRLVCPTNRIGGVDLLQVSHHGLELSSAPQLVHAVAPVVAVMNNGPTKGGAAVTFDTLKASPGLQDLWAVHRAINNDAAHNATEPLTANITTAPDGAYFLKASVAADGSYQVTNSRNGETRTYLSR